MVPRTSLFSIRRNPVRWTILCLLSVMYFITFLDKASISVAAPMISREFGLDKASMGLIFSAFVIGTALGQVPAGWLADRFGPRRVLAIFVGFWSAMMALTAFGTGAWSFSLVRFVTGLGESGAFPGGTRAVKPWFARADRGFVQGMPHFFARFGTAVVPAVGVGLSLWWGWRSIFYVFSALGLLWVGFFYWLYRDDPESHPRLGPIERAQTHLISVERGREGDAARRTPWKQIMSARSMWGMIVGSISYTYSIFFFTTWLPTYLIEYRHFSLAQMGILASMPLIAGMIGDVVGGVLTDRILIATGRLGFARKVVIIPALVASAVAVVPAATVATPLVSVICLSLVLLFLEMVNGPWWAVPIDIGGAFAGTVTGVMNAAGNAIGALSPTIFGLFVQRGNWTTPFIITACVLLCGAVGGSFVDPETSIVPDRAAPA